MIFAPRSCPSSPGLAMTTLIFRATVPEFSLGPVKLKGVVWLGTRTAHFDESHPGGGHPAGIAGGFLVDDAEAAAAEFRAAGVEVSEVGSAGAFRWAYFRAPDGNLYEVTSGPYR